MIVRHWLACHNVESCEIASNFVITESLSVVVRCCYLEAIAVGYSPNQSAEGYQWDTRVVSRSPDEPALRFISAISRVRGKASDIARVQDDVCSIYRDKSKIHRRKIDDDGGVLCPRT